MINRTKVERWALPIALGLSFLCLLPSLFNGWVNWDDYSYIRDNHIIQNLSWRAVQKILGTTQVLGLYHPLTLLSYAFEYRLVGDLPFLYHFDNLLLHLLNIALVYYLSLQLLKNPVAAMIIAMLFGVHPMHVESVAWISARKDLLFTTFYLFSLGSYLKYRNVSAIEQKIGFYFLSLLCFAASILSKSMAMTLPVILVALDVLFKRRMKGFALTDKIPFILMAFLFALIAIMAQQEATAMNKITEMPLQKTSVVAIYNLLIFSIKALIPYSLSAFHPYPFSHHTVIPWYVYLSFIPLLSILLFTLRITRDRAIYFFGIAFFIITLLPVLKILPFGRGIMADRYSYLPYLGLFIIFANWITNNEDFSQDQIRLKQAFTLIIILIFSVISFNRTLVWKNGETLWSDVIKKYPYSFMGYVNLADYHKANGNSDLAIKYFDLTLKKDSLNSYALLERGRLLSRQSQYETALEDFTKLISSGNDKFGAYINRALLFYSKLNQPDAAIADLDSAIMIAPFEAKSYLNKGVILEHQNQFDQAYECYTTGINKGINDARLYRYRGAISLQEQNFNQAIIDMTKALEIKSDYSEAYFLRSKAFLGQGNTELARKDAYSAKDLGYNIQDDYLNLFK